MFMMNQWIQKTLISRSNQASIALVASLLGACSAAGEETLNTSEPTGATASEQGVALVPAALPGQFVIQTVLKGNYLTAVGGGGRVTDVIHTDATQALGWEKFKLAPYPQTGPSYTLGLYTIQTATGNYLTAVGGGGRVSDVVHTDATQPQSWEKFQLQAQAGAYYGAFALGTATGNYLTALGGGGHTDPSLHSDATRVGSWEMFWLLKTGALGSGVTYRIATRLGAYLLANRFGGQTHNAIGDTSTFQGLWSDEQTRFTLLRQHDGTYAIRTPDGHFVTAVGGGGRTTDVLHTDAFQVQAWEKFRFIEQGTGDYVIMTVGGYYFGAGPETISTNVRDLNSARRFKLTIFAD